MSEYDTSKLRGKNLVSDGYFKSSSTTSKYETVLYKGPPNPELPWRVPESDIYVSSSVYKEPTSDKGLVSGKTGALMPVIAVAGGFTTAMSYKLDIAPNTVENQLMYIRMTGKAIGGPTTAPNSPVMGGIGVRGYGWLYNGLTEADHWYETGPETAGFVTWTASNLFFMGDALSDNTVPQNEALRQFFVMTTTHTNTIYLQEAVLVNLTDVFGAGNEPSKDWCDENINYNTLEVKKEDTKMGRLTWDEDGKRLYETGTRMGVLYVKDKTGTYPTGVPWSGLTAVTESPSGAENTALYADDIKYLNLRSAEEFGGTIEAYTYPDEFMQCDGSAELSPGVYIGQQDRKSFGLCYRTVIGNDTENTAHGYKLHLVYGCDASPSERAYSTINDSPEAITFSWEFTTTPVNVTGAKPTALLTIDSTKVDEAKLKTLEDILYGKDGTSDSDTGTTARLPLPDEVAAIFAAG